MAGKVEYPGRDRHVRQVANYVRNTTRLRYSREELSHVCSFLGLVSEEREAFEKLVKKGVRLFPEAPEFHMMLGTLELEKGPFRANLPQARTHLEKGLERAQAEQASNPRAPEMIKEIRRVLSRIDTLTSGPLGLPFGASPFGGPEAPFGGPGSLPAQLLDIIESMGLDPADLDPYEDDDYDDEDDFEDIPLPLPRGPRPQPPQPGGRKGKGKKGKKRKKR